MTAANQQIVTAYEDNGMSIAEIAEDFEMEEFAVKAMLMQNSAVYRKEMKQKPDMNFTDDEAVEMKNIIVSLARYSEDPLLQFRCAKYILDDKKGRLDVGNRMNQVNVNVITFNEQMERAMKAAQRTIDISSKLLPA